MSNRHSPVTSGPAPNPAFPDTNVPDFIRNLARQRGDAIAIIDAASDRSISYGELDRLIGRCAAGLVAHGFRPGDTMLMFAPNLPEWPIVALAAMAAGGVVSGANPMYSAADLAQQMGDTNARFAFTIPPLLATVREAAASASECETIVVLGEGEDALSYNTLIASDGIEPVPAPDPDALAALPYSSGTSGLPKGVMLSHRMLVTNVCQFNQNFAMPEHSVALAMLPMFHIFGFTVIMLCGLVRGATLISMQRFEPEVFVKAIARHRISHMFVVPPVMQFLAMHPLVEQHDLSSLRMVASGAAPLGAELERRVGARLGCAVVQGYGMTEASGCISIPHPDRIRAGSCGTLVAATEARLVDPDTGLDVPRGQTGELWFRGPQAFLGYRNKPDATTEMRSADGWIRTGDIGHIDDDGYVFITDRLKDLIKVKSFQVAPAELEALLLSHPGIADAAVIGRADERAGEMPVAFVVPRGTLEPSSLLAWVAERVTSYKQLGDVVLCDAIPKNPAGKILRRLLRMRDAEANANANAGHEKG